MTDPAPEIPFPLPTNYAATQEGHVRHHNKLSYTVNQVRSSLPVSLLNYANTSASDQTGNVQAAVAATPTGGTLEVPAAMLFRVSGQVNVDRAMTIRSSGRGGFYSAAGVAAQRMFNVTADNVAFDNLTIAGPQFATMSEQHGIWAVGTVADRIYNLRVTNCEIHSWSQSAIWVQFVGVFTFNHNNIHDIGYVGVGVQSGSIGSVSFNRIDNITGAGWETPGYGMFSSRGYGTLAVHPRTEDVAIHGNTITNVPNWAGIDSHGSRALSIVGNTVRNCHMPITMVSSKDDTDTYVFATIDTAIVGNVVDAVNQGTKRSVHFVGSPVEKATGCIVGNTIRGHGTGNVNSGGIELGHTRGVTVSGNSIVEPNPNGIVLNYGNYGFTITGNTITDPWSETANTKAIWVETDQNTGTIAGNTLVSAGKTATYTNANSGLGIGVRQGISGTDIIVGTNSMTAASNPYYDPSGLQRTPLGSIPTITGSRGGNAALASLLTQLATKGLIVNSTT